MKGYITNPTLFGHPEIIGFGEDDFYVRIIDRDKANDIIIKNHYSGKITSHSYIHLGVFIENNMLGVLQAGYAMNPASGSSIVPDTKSDEFCELNRMWLSDDAPRNSESKCISFMIKYIKAKYPKIKFIMSFADERCGMNGIVYQASNFIYYGEHTNIFWELDGQFFHNVIMTNGSDQSLQARILRTRKSEAKKNELRQFRYIFWINPKSRLKCLLRECPYPKYYIDEVNC